LAEAHGFIYLKALFQNGLSMANNTFILSENSENHSLVATIAKFAFITFIFFTFFGTTIPFQSKAGDLEEATTSNVTNQLIFSSLFLISIVCIFLKHNKIGLIIRKEKLLSIFLLWCFISILWSDFKLVAFKRWFQVVTIIPVALAYLEHIDHSKTIFRHLKFVIYSYVLVTLVSVIFIPGAKDPAFNTWRGLAFTKNHLGQSVVMCSIFAYNFILLSNPKEKIFSTMLLVFCVILLIGTESSTSILTFIIILTIIILGTLNKIFSGNLKLGKVYIFFLCISLIMLIFLIYVVSKEIFTQIPELFGKDITFTGRTALWQDIFSYTKEYLITGCGFESFWVLDRSNVNLVDLYHKYVWFPNQSHCGYLDILNHVGIIGLVIFILMLIKYFYYVARTPIKNGWVWIVIATLIINFQETTLFRPRHLTGILFIIAYLSIYLDNITESKKRSAKT
jgi:exopolysaccharide production protein ExoQ